MLLHLIHQGWSWQHDHSPLLHGRTTFYTNVRPGGFHRQQQGHGNGGQQQPSSPVAQLLAFLPVLLLLAFTFFSSQTEPVR